VSLLSPSAKNWAEIFHADTHAVDPTVSHSMLRRRHSLSIRSLQPSLPIFRVNIRMQDVLRTFHFCYSSECILIDCPVNLQMVLPFSLTRSPMLRPTPLNNVSPYVLLMVTLLLASSTVKSAGVVRNMFVKRPNELINGL
jgi:hypothetical protein